MPADNKEDFFSKKAKKTLKNPSEKNVSKKNKGFKFQTLEQRMVFDAAAGITLRDTFDKPDVDSLVDSFLKSSGMQTTERELLPPVDQNTNNSIETEKRQQEVTENQEGRQQGQHSLGERQFSRLIVVDKSVVDYEKILLPMRKLSKVIVLDSNEDGVERIVKEAALMGKLDAVHIISHGTPGELKLGSALLNQHTVDGIYADELSALKSHLSEQADILLYGCDVGAGDQGDLFMHRLSLATGADVAASDDTTGGEKHKADWELEKRTGIIDASMKELRDILSDYSHTLDVGTEAPAISGASNVVWRKSVFIAPEVIISAAKVRSINSLEVKVENARLGNKLKIEGADKNNYLPGVREKFTIQWDERACSLTIQGRANILEYQNFLRLMKFESSQNLAKTIKITIQDDRNKKSFVNIKIIPAVGAAPVLKIDNPAFSVKAWEVLSFYESLFGYSDSENDPWDSLELVAFPSLGDLYLGQKKVIAGERIPASERGKLRYVAHSDKSGTETLRFIAHNAKGSSDEAYLAIAVVGGDKQHGLTKLDGFAALPKGGEYAFKVSDFTFTDEDENIVGSPVYAIAFTSRPMHGQLKIEKAHNGQVKIEDVTINELIYLANIPKIRYISHKNHSGFDQFSFLLEYQDINWLSNVSTYPAYFKLGIGANYNESVLRTSDEALLVNAGESLQLDTNLFDYSDAEGDQWEYFELVTSPGLGNLLVGDRPVSPGERIPASERGNLNYRAHSSSSGEETIKIKISIPGNRSREVSVKIEVNEAGVDSQANEGSKPLLLSRSLTIHGRELYTLKPDDFYFKGSDGDSILEIVGLPKDGKLKFDGRDILPKELKFSDIPKLTYDPERRLNGEDKIIFKVKTRNSQWSDSANLNIRIGSLSNEQSISSESTEGVKPVIRARSALASLKEDETYSFTLDRFSVEDSEGHAPKSVRILSLPSFGSLTIDRDSVSVPIKINDIIVVSDLSKLKYKPNANAHGSDKFKFQIQDMGGLWSNEAQFNLTIAPVDDKPVLRMADGVSLSVKSGATLGFGKDLFDYSDAEGDVCTFLEVVSPPLLGDLYVGEDKVVVGSGGYEITYSDLLINKLSYRAHLSKSGTETLRFTAHNVNGESNPVSVDIAVTAAEVVSSVVDPGKGDSTSGREGPSNPDETDSSGAGDTRPVLSASADPADSLSVRVGGDLPLGDKFFDYYDADGDQLESLEFINLTRGSLILYNGAAINKGDSIKPSDLGNAVYRSDKDAHPGTETISFKARNSRGSSDAFAFEITVKPAGDAPVARDASASLDEHGEHIFQLSDFPFTDTDNDALRDLFIYELPKYGTLERQTGTDAEGNPSWTAVEEDEFVSVDLFANGDLKYTRNDSNPGIDSFTFGLQDSGGNISGEATFRLTPYEPVMKPEVAVTARANPVASAGSASLTEDVEYSFTSDKFPFTDGEDDKLKSVKIIRLPGKGNLTIDGAAVELNRVISVSDLSKLKYEPRLNENGKDSFDYELEDMGGSLSNKATFNLTINPVPDVPVLRIAGGEALSVKVGDELRLDTSLFNYTDVDVADATPDLIRVSKFPVKGRLFYGAGASKTEVTSAELDITYANLATLHYIPGSSSSGVETIEFRAVKGARISNPVSVDITVNLRANPVALAASESLTEDVEYSFTSDKFPMTDDENDKLKSVKIVSLPKKGSLTVDGAAVELNRVISVSDLSKLKYEPRLNENGKDSFDYELEDMGGSLSNKATFNLTINPVPDVPVLRIAGGEALSVKVGATLGLGSNFVYTDVDVADATQDFIRVSKFPVKGRLFYGAGASKTEVTAEKPDIAYANLATLHYIPGSSSSGKETISFTAHKGSRTSLPASVEIAITEAERGAEESNLIAEEGVTPIVKSASATLNEDRVYPFRDYNFSIVDAKDAKIKSEDIHSIKILTLPGNGKLFERINNTNLEGVQDSRLIEVLENRELLFNKIDSFEYEPNINYSGADQFQFQVIHKNGSTSAKSIFALNVLPVDDKPVLTRAGGEGLSVKSGATLGLREDLFVYNDADEDVWRSLEVVSPPLLGDLYVGEKKVVLGSEGYIISYSDLLINKLSYRAHLSKSGTETLRFTAHNVNGESNPASLEIAVTARANPLASPSSASLSEDGDYSFSEAQFSMTDEDRDALKSVKIISLPTKGSLTIDGAAGVSVPVTINDIIVASDLSKLKYKPRSNENGRDNFKFQIQDSGESWSNEATFDLNVAPVPDVPVLRIAGGAALSVKVGDELRLDANLFNYTDVDASGATLDFIRVIKLPAQGSLFYGAEATKTEVTGGKPDITYANLATLRYVSRSGSSGKETISFTAHKGDRISNTVSVDIAITPRARPVIDRASASINEDSSHLLRLSNFVVRYGENNTLKNVKIKTLPDPEKGKLEFQTGTYLDSEGRKTFTYRDLRINETISASDLSKLKYTPKPDYHGADSFEFELEDTGSSWSDRATFDLTIDSVDDQPVTRDASASLDEKGEHIFRLADFPFSDADGETLASVRIHSLPAHGKLERKTGGAGSNPLWQDVEEGGELFVDLLENGGLKYTRNGNHPGSDSFEFYVRDSSGSFSAETPTFMLTPYGDNRPVLSANPAHSLSVRVGRKLRLGDKFFTYDDADGDKLETLQFIDLTGGYLVGADGGAINKGDSILRSDLGNVDYFAPVGQSGTETIKFKAYNAKGSSDEVAFEITVKPAGYAPVVGAASASLDEHGEHIFQSSDFTFSDEDNDTLASVKISAFPQNGKLERKTGQDADGNPSWQAVKLYEELSVDLLKNGGLKYTRKGDSPTSDSFRFYVVDSGGDESGVAAFTLMPYKGGKGAEVAVKPRANPVALAASESLTEDVEYSFTSDKFPFRDEDGDKLKNVKIVSLPKKGNLTIDGLVVELNRVISASDLSKLKYEPRLNENGKDSFDYELEDMGGSLSDKATFDLTIDSVDDQPVTRDASVSLNASGEHIFQLSDFHFSDADGDTLRFVRIFALPAHGKLMRKTGQDADGNPSWTAVEEEEVLDVDLLENGGLKYTRNDSHPGSDSFRFYVVDSGDDESGVAAFTLMPYKGGKGAEVAVKPRANPVALAASESLTEDVEYSFTSDKFPFRDEDRDALKSVKIVSLPRRGILTIDGVAVGLNRVISVSDLSKLKYTPNANAHGKDRFDYQLEDMGGSLSDKATFDLTIDSVDDQPVTRDASVSLNASGEHIFQLSDFHFSDADGDTLRFVRIFALPAHGKLMRKTGQDADGNPSWTAVEEEESDLDVDLLKNGGLKYTRNDSHPGSDSFRFDVVDSNDDASDGTATFRLTPYEGATTSEVSPPGKGGGTPGGEGPSVPGETDSSGPGDNRPVLSANPGHSLSVRLHKYIPLGDKFFDYEDADGDKLLSLQFIDLTGGSLWGADGGPLNPGDSILRSDLGRVVYRPGNSSGTETIKFKAHNAKGFSDVVAFEIRVKPAGHNPVVQDASVSLNGHGEHIFRKSDFTFEDADKDTLVSVHIYAAPENGRLERQTEGADGNPSWQAVEKNEELSVNLLENGGLKYTRNDSHPGSDSFRFYVVDSGDDESGVAAFMLTPYGNTRPVLSASSAHSLLVRLGGSIRFGDKFFTYHDADGDKLESLQFIDLTGGSLRRASGSTINKGDSIKLSDLDKVIYSPGNSSGTETIKFKAHNTNGSSDEVAFEIKVMPAGHAPVTRDGSASLNASGEHIFQLSDFSFIDADNDTLASVNISAVPQNGKLMCKTGRDTDGNPSWTAVEAFQPLFVDLLKNGGLKYIGDPSTPDSFVFYVRDSGGYLSGEPTFRLTPYQGGTRSEVAVKPRANPVALAASEGLTEDEVYSFTSDKFPFTDDENDKLKSVKIISLPKKGSLTIDGVVVELNRVISASDLSKLKYEPRLNENGKDSFDYQLEDMGGSLSDKATFDLNVAPVPDAPVTRDAFASLDEHGEHIFRKSDFTFSDADGDTLAVVYIDLRPKKGKLMRQTEDAAGVSSWQAVQVSEPLSVDLLENGGLKYIGNRSTSDSFTFFVEDSRSDPSNKTATFTLTPYQGGTRPEVAITARARPVALAASTSLTEDGEHFFLEAEFPFTDDENDRLKSVKIINLPTKGILTVDGAAVGLNRVISASDLSKLKYTPKPDYHGADSFEFELEDTGSSWSDRATFDLTIDSVDDQPVTRDASASLDEKGEHIFRLADFPFSDADGETLASVRIHSLPAHGKLERKTGGAGSNPLWQDVEEGGELFVDLLENGGLKYTRNGNHPGSDSFEFYVRDSSGSFSAETPTFMLTPYGDNRPVLSANPAHSLSVRVGRKLRLGDKFFTYDDADGDKLETLQFIDLTGGYLVGADGGAINKGDSILRSDLGNVDYFAPVGQSGTETIKFKAYNAKGSSDEVAFEITVKPAGYAPVVGAASASLDEHGEHIFQSSDFTFSDEDNDTLASVKISAFPQNGKLERKTGQDADGNPSWQAVKLYEELSVDLLKNGGLKYTRKGDSPTSDSFRFYVVDSGGDESGVAAFMLTPYKGGTTSQVTSTARARPVASAASESLTEDVEYSFTSDKFPFTDDENDKLKSVKIVNLPKKGSLTVDGAAVGLNKVISVSDLSKLKYTPSANAHGKDSFDYQLEDMGGSLSDKATFDLNVAPVPDAPVTRDAFASLDEHGEHIFRKSDFTFSDADGDTLAVVYIDLRPKKGKLMRQTEDAAGVSSWQAVQVSEPLSVDLLENGGLKYIGNRSTSDSFTFFVEDSRSDPSNKTATFTLTPYGNTRPVLSASSAHSLLVRLGGSIRFGDKFFTYHDADGDKLESLQFIDLTGGSLRRASGSTINKGDSIKLSDLDKVIYSPGNSSGTETIKFKAHNTNGSSDEVAFEIKVMPAGHAPVTRDGSASLNASGEHIFQLSDFSFIDADNDTLASVNISAVPQNGKLMCKTGRDTDGNPSWTAVEAFQPLFVDLLKNGGLKYIGDPSTPDSFVFYVRDSGGYLSGEPTFRLTPYQGGTRSEVAVKPRANPVALAASEGLTEDVEYSFTSDKFPFTDDENDKLKSVKIISLPKKGSLTIDGVVVELNRVISASDLSKLKYEPRLNENGKDSFDYQLEDMGGSLSARATFNLTIRPVDDLPVTKDASVSLNEDGEHIFRKADFTFSDADGDTLAVVYIDLRPKKGKLMRQTEDAAGVSSWQAVQVSEPLSVDLLENGGLKYIGNRSTSDSFTFFVEDSRSDPSNKTATFTLTPYQGGTRPEVAITARARPVALAASTSLTEDGEHFFLEAEFPFTDDENDRLKSVKIINLPKKGSLTVDGAVVVLGNKIPASNLSKLKYTPNANANGKDSFGYQLEDMGGSLSDQATFDLMIDAVPDQPIIRNASVSLNERGEHIFQPYDFPFEDADDDTLVYVRLFSLPNNGKLERRTGVDSDGNPSWTAIELHEFGYEFLSVGLLADGRLKYTRNRDYSGSDSFRFWVEDSSGNESDVIATFRLTPYQGGTTSEVAPPVKGGGTSVGETASVTDETEVTGAVDIWSVTPKYTIFQEDMERSGWKLQNPIEDRIADKQIIKEAVEKIGLLTKIGSLSSHSDKYSNTEISYSSINAESLEQYRSNHPWLISLKIKSKIYLHFSIADEIEKEDIENYSLRMKDGSKLPSWLKRIGPKTFAGLPNNYEVLDLVILISHKNGTVKEKIVRLDTKTGKLSEFKSPEKKQSYLPEEKNPSKLQMFSQEIQTVSMFSDIESLEVALGFSNEDGDSTNLENETRF